MRGSALLNSFHLRAIPSSRNLDAGETVTNMPSLCSRHRHVCHLIFGSCQAEEQLPGTGNRTGKTWVAWVVSDSSSFCASITPFGILVAILFFIFFMSCSPKHFVHNKCKLTCLFTEKKFRKWKHRSQRAVLLTLNVGVYTKKKKRVLLICWLQGNWGV